MNGGAKAPPPVGPGPYGLERIRRGVYLHRSGKYILQTHEWEGPRGGKFSLWEAAVWEDGSGWTVDGFLGARTLRQAAADLDREERKSSETPAS